MIIGCNFITTNSNKNEEWRLVSRLNTVSIYENVNGGDVNLEMLKPGLQKVWTNVIDVNNIYIAFVKNVKNLYKGDDDYLMDYEELVKDKKELMKEVFWYKVGTRDKITIKHIILNEQAVNKKMKFLNNLVDFDCQYELELLNKESAEIFKMYLCKISRGVIVFDKQLGKGDGYFYTIHDNKVLKFWLYEYGWYLFKEHTGREFLLNDICSNLNN